MITGRLQGEHRKLVVRAFGFLQTDNVRLGCIEPGKKAILTFAQRIDIPRGDFRHLL
jgi:hypothetical protein